MFDALFTTTTEYKKLSHALSGKGACALFGLPASGRAQVYAALCRQLDKPLCIVTPGEAEATHFADDLKALGLAAAVFPPRDLCCAQWRARAASTSTAAFRCWAPLQAGG